MLKNTPEFALFSGLSTAHSISVAENRTALNRGQISQKALVALESVLIAETGDLTSAFIANFVLFLQAYGARGKCCNFQNINVAFS
jgi:hypothetical protein